MPEKLTLFTEDGEWMVEVYAFGSSILFTRIGTVAAAYQRRSTVRPGPWKPLRPWSSAGPWKPFGPWGGVGPWMPKGPWESKGPWSDRGPWAPAGPWAPEGPWSKAGPWQGRADWESASVNLISIENRYSGKPDDAVATRAAKEENTARVVLQESGFGTISLESDSPEGEIVRVHRVEATISVRIGEETLGGQVEFAFR